MVEIETTTISSKGQVVIPSNFRKEFKEGDKLIIIRSNNQLILKKASNLDENFAEDLEFARRTKEAFGRYEKGEFKSLPANKFIELLDKC